MIIKRLNSHQSKVHYEMKTLTLIFLLVMSYSCHALEKTTGLNNVMSSNEDVWKLVEYKQENSAKVWFFRKNIGAKTLRGHDSLTTLVYFTVEYSPDDETGLPSKSDANKLYDFEDNVIPLVEAEAGCILVASVIKEGIKDHLFYVSDAKTFLDSISKYKASLNGFNVSLEKADDPTWKIYDDFPEGT